MKDGTVLEYAVDAKSGGPGRIVRRSSVSDFEASTTTSKPVPDSAMSPRPADVAGPFGAYAMSGSIQTSTGAGATNVRVRACTSTSSQLCREAYTDAAGSYRIANLPAGWYRVDVRVYYWMRSNGPAGSWYYSEATSGSLTTNSYLRKTLPLLDGDLTLSTMTLPASGALAGTVVDAATSAGIDGAEVGVFGDQSYQYAFAYTNADGTFTLPPLLPGRYQLQVTAPEGSLYLSGYLDASTGAFVVTSPSSDRRTTVTIGATATVRIPLSKGRRITGAVTKPAGVAASSSYVEVCPTSGSVLCLWSWIGNQTSYTTSGLPAGTYRIYAQSYDDPPTFYETTGVTVGSDADTTGNDIALRRYGSMSGVVSGTDGSRIADAFLSICSSSYDCSYATSQADGTWSANDVVPGTYRVTVWPPDRSRWLSGYYRTGVPGNYTSGDIANATWLTSNWDSVGGIDISLPAGRLISGRVTFGSGRSAFDAEVRICNSSDCWFVYTAEDGSYVSPGLVSDMWDVEVYPPSGSPLASGYYDAGAPYGWNPTGPTPISTMAGDAVMIDVRLPVAPVNEPTTTGTDVSVTPLDPVTLDRPATMTFGEVTADGTTNVTALSSWTDGTAYGFSVASRYYDITTTADWSTGQGVEVCITGSAPARIYHWENGGWTDGTNAVPNDYRNGKVCGTFHSLSPFVLGTSSARLTVVKAGAGSGTVTSSPAGISCGSTCGADFAANSTVVLTASAGANSTFSGWSGVSCPGTGTCTVTMSAARTVTATFGTSTPVGPPPSGGGGGPVLLEQTITFTAPASAAVGSTLTLTGTASSKLAVNYKTLTTSVCTVSGSVVTFVAAGTCTVEASQAGDGTYAAATSVSKSITVAVGKSATLVGRLGLGKVGNATTLAVKKNAKIVVSVTVPTALAGLSIRLWVRETGKAWRGIATKVVGANGKVQVTIYAKVGASYQWRFAGGSGWKASTSNTVVIRLR